MTPLDEPKSKSEDGIALLDEQGDKKIFIRKKKSVNQSFFFFINLKKKSFSDSDSIPSIIIVNENDSNADEDDKTSEDFSSSLSDRLSNLEISKPNRAKSAPVDSDRCIPILPKLPSRMATLDWEAEEEDEDESRKSL